MKPRKHIWRRAAGAKSTEGAMELAVWRRKPRTYAKAATGIAALCSMAAITLLSAYSVPHGDSGYGPGSAVEIYREIGVTDKEQEMIADIYSGVMASETGFYCI